MLQHASIFVCFIIFGPLLRIQFLVVSLRSKITAEQFCSFSFLTPINFNAIVVQHDAGQFVFHGHRDALVLVVESQVIYFIGVVCQAV